MKKVAVKALSFFIVVIGVLGITACDGGLSSIESSELRERAYKCEMSVDLSAAEIQVCKNILRECKRRQSKGQYDC